MSHGKMNRVTAVVGMIDLVEGKQQIWMLEDGTERLVHILESPGC